MCKSTRENCGSTSVCDSGNIMIPAYFLGLVTYTPKITTSFFQTKSWFRDRCIAKVQDLKMEQNESMCPISMPRETKKAPC